MCCLSPCCGTALYNLNASPGALAVRSCQHHEQAIIPETWIGQIVQPSLYLWAVSLTLSLQNGFPFLEEDGRVQGGTTSSSSLGWGGT